MLDALYNLPPIVATLFILFVTAFVSVGGLLLLRRFQPHTRAEPNNEVAGFIFAGVGVVYAVVLAFVMVVLWEQFTGTNDTIEHEASSLGTMYRESRGLPDPVGADIRRHIYAYTETVLHDEWNTMAFGLPSDRAFAEYTALWSAVRAVHPTNDAEANWHQALITRLNNVADARRIRLSRAAYHAPPLLWILLVLGAVVTVGFSYLYGVENLAVHAIMTGSLACLVVLTMYATYELEYPFRGSEQADRSPFERELSYYALDGPGVMTPASAPRQP